jgi:hypothetical protein
MENNINNEVPYPIMPKLSHMGSISSYCLWGSTESSDSLGKVLTNFPSHSYRRFISLLTLRGGNHIFTDRAEVLKSIMYPHSLSRRPYPLPFTKLSPRRQGELIPSPFHLGLNLSAPCLLFSDDYYSLWAGESGKSAKEATCRTDWSLPYPQVDEAVIDSWGFEMESRRGVIAIRAMERFRITPRWHRKVRPSASPPYYYSLGGLT